MQTFRSSALFVVLVIICRVSIAGTIIVTSVADNNIRDDVITLREGILFALGLETEPFDDLDEDTIEEDDFITGPFGAGIRDTIEVALDDGAVITLAEPLPVLSDPGDIIRAGSKVVLNGAAISTVSTDIQGFRIAADEVDIRGFTVRGFPVGVEVNADRVRVGAMFIEQSTGLAGLRLLNANFGEFDNIVTRDNEGAGVRLSLDTTQNTLRSIFSYRNLTGIILSGDGVTTNTIHSSAFGVTEENEQGEFEYAGNSGFGIDLFEGPSGNRFGDPSNDASFTFVAGNDLGGIRLTGSGTRNNLFHSMTVGGFSGSDEWIGNGEVAGESFGHGILVENGANHNQFGLSRPNTVMAIGGHVGNGILLKDFGTDNNSFNRCDIGWVDPLLSSELQMNAGHGIEIRGGIKNTNLGFTPDPQDFFNTHIEINESGGHGLFLNGNDPENPIENTLFEHYHIGDRGVEGFDDPDPYTIGLDGIRISGNVDGVVIGLANHPNTTNGSRGYGINIEGENVRDVELIQIIMGERFGFMIPNQLGGIRIANGASNIRFAQGDPLLEVTRTSFVSGNMGPGILIEGGNTPPPSNVKLGNLVVGLRQFGGPPLPNQGPGILIRGGFESLTPTVMEDILLGDLTESYRVVSSGNAEAGLHIVNASGIKVRGSVFGLDVNELIAVPNEADGIVIESSENIEIGDVDAEDFARNNIAGNTDAGIRITKGSHNLKIHNNRIGSEFQEIPNDYGVIVEAPGPTEGQELLIGGTNTGLGSVQQERDLEEGNLISGNRIAGVLVGLPVGEQSKGETPPETIERVIIQGNLIGPTLAGNEMARTRQTAGVLVAGEAVRDVLIGGSQDSFGNLISGNGGDGVLIERGAQGVVVHRNAIGTQPDENDRLPNGWNGVALLSGAHSNEVLENVIWYNERRGVYMDGEDVRFNTLRNNSFHLNIRNAIQLENGANESVFVEKFELLPETKRNPDIITFQSNVPNGVLEIFVDPVVQDEAGQWGQAKDRIRRVTADADGEFTLPVSEIAQTGIITATITDATGNTSELTPWMDGFPVQVVGNIPSDAFVANKLTAVRIYGDTGVNGPQVMMDGEVITNDSFITRSAAPYNMREQSYWLTVQRVFSRAGGSEAATVLAPKTTGPTTFQIRFRQNGTDFIRGRHDLGEFNFQDTNTVTIQMVPITMPDRNGTAATPTMAQMLDSVATFYNIYPIAWEKANIYLASNLVYSSRPSNATFGPPFAISDVFRYRISAVGKTGIAEFIVGLYDIDDTDSFYQGIAGFTLSITSSTMIAPASTSQRLIAGTTIAHEVGHKSPFRLSDTYRGAGVSPTINSPNPNPLPTPLPDGTVRVAGLNGEQGIRLLEGDRAFMPANDDRNFPVPFRDDRRQGGLEFNDFMGDSSGVISWTDPGTYLYLFERLGGSLAGNQKIKQPPKQEMLNNPIVISAIAGLDDSVQFLEARRLDAQIPAFETSLTNVPAEYRMELLNDEGETISSVDFPLDFRTEILDEGFGRRSIVQESVPFSIPLERFTTTTTAAVIVKRGELEIGRLEPSDHAPEIEAEFIQTKGSVLELPITIEWEATDADEDELTVDILYTPDGGETQFPVVLRRDASSSFTVTQEVASHLPMGDEASFLIQARDSWHETELELGPFIKENAAPLAAAIKAPREGESLAVQSQVVLSGFGYDTEDGVLSGDSLQWFVNDEEAGAGEGIVAQLEEGETTIRLVATDSMGASTFDEITLGVTDNDDIREIWIIGRR